MSNYNINDGGIGFLDFSNKDTIMQTQTIRLDNLPAFDLLFTGTDKTLINSPGEISASYANALEASTKNNGKAVGMSGAMLLNQPIHFLKIDVEGFELQALESAARLFEGGLIEHCVLEFGPPDRWDVTVENREGLALEKIRAETISNSKRILHQVTEEWDMDIYLLPAIGWERTVSWMLDRGVSFNKKNLPNKNKIVHRLMAWDFDGRPQDMDEFEAELEAKGGLVTEVIPLREDLIDDYMDSLESIGEMYLWFAKRNGNSAVLEKLEL
ncbi:hypothetical protein BX666DRAFT_1904186 [Dichotomocladium elegans]|nr:hypothetical protein BX666DRAFT_1904186 [Dichotomocladium elegans]